MECGRWSGEGTYEGGLVSMTVELPVAARLNVVVLSSGTVVVSETVLKVVDPPYKQHEIQTFP
jgi:hypothetical protein